MWSKVKCTNADVQDHHNSTQVGEGLVHINTEKQRLK